jgi:hypothetical protein
MSVPLRWLTAKQLLDLYLPSPAYFLSLGPEQKKLLVDALTHSAPGLYKILVSSGEGIGSYLRKKRMSRFVHSALCLRLLVTVHQGGDDYGVEEEDI